jgi:hypothetical protein
MGGVSVLALRETDDQTSELRELFQDIARILNGVGMPRAGLEAARIMAALARNRKYQWSSLRMALEGHPELLSRLPDRVGAVDGLPLGLASYALKD